MLKLDWASLRRLAVAAQVDPRTIQAEFAACQAGTRGPGLARERARAALIDAGIVRAAPPEPTITVCEPKP